MKRLVLLFFIILSVAACDLNPKPVTIQVLVSRSYIILDPEQTEQINFTISPADSGIKPIWRSSNLSVASVSQDGLITAIGPGEATITADVDTQEGDLCAIQVRVRTAIMKLSFELDSVEIVESLSSLLELQILPDDAECTEIEWKSSDEDIATVINGDVTAKSIGSCTISAKSTHWDITSECYITVLSAEPRTVYYSQHGDGTTFVRNYRNPIIAHQTIGDNTYRFIARDSIIVWGKDFEFSSPYSVKTISFPSCVREIKKESFEFWSRLEDVKLHEGLEIIGYSAFRSNGLKSVTIPNSVTSIGECSFMNCKELEDVTIGDNVTTIPIYAFSHCTNLKSVKLGAGIRHLGFEAFSHCENLESLWFSSPEPCTLYVSGYNIFYGCPQFTVYVPKGSAEAYKCINWDHSIEIVEY